MSRIAYYALLIDYAIKKLNIKITLPFYDNRLVSCMLVALRQLITKHESLALYFAILRYWMHRMIGYSHLSAHEVRSL